MRPCIPCPHCADTIELLMGIAADGNFCLCNTCCAISVWHGGLLALPTRAEKAEFQTIVDAGEAGDWREKIEKIHLKAGRWG